MQQQRLSSPEIIHKQLNLNPFARRNPANHEKEQDPRPDPKFCAQDPVTNAYHIQITEFALKHHLPSLFGRKEPVEGGGLMSYGPSQDELFRRIPAYIDKILKGAKPADLPVEQPMKFELVINLKTAQKIGLTIPQNVLARADRVIK